MEDPGIETELADLSEMSLDELRTRDPDFLAPYLQALFQQVERPRINLGGGGPPGRAD